MAKALPAFHVYSRRLSSYPWHLKSITLSGLNLGEGLTSGLGIGEGLGTTADLEQLQMKLLSLLGNSTVLLAAASSGDESTVKNFLTKNPQEVGH